MTTTPSADKSRGKPNEVDAHVGRRVRERRLIIKLSPETLADRLGLTVKQLQKYERGDNRLVSGRLYALCEALEVPVTYFFEGAPPPPKVRVLPEALAARAARGALPVAPTGDVMASTETRRLVRAYYGVEDPQVRRSFVALMEGMAEIPMDRVPG